MGGLKNPSRWQLDMAVVDVTEPEFAGLIENNNIVILDFWAEWCGPCKAYGPVFKRVSEDYPDVVFAKINTEQEQALSQSFEIRSIPTTIAFKEGIGVFMMPGALPEKDLRELVVKLGEINMDEVRAQLESEETSENSQ